MARVAPDPTTSREENETALLIRASAFDETPTLALLTAETLLEITCRSGIDFATAVLYDRVKGSLQHAPFIARIDELLSCGDPSSTKRDFTIAIVPAAFYKEKPHSGADGRVVIEAAAQI